MPQEDLIMIIKTIDNRTAIGKRDYSILMLAVISGMRAGDIANIELSDIDWRKNEFHIIQGKTQNPISHPIYKSVGTVAQLLLTIY